MGGVFAALYLLGCFKGTTGFEVGALENINNMGVIGAVGNPAQGGSNSAVSAFGYVLGKAGQSVFGPEFTSSTTFPDMAIVAVKPTTNTGAIMLVNYNLTTNRTVNLAQSGVGFSGTVARWEIGKSSSGAPTSPVPANSNQTSLATISVPSETVVILTGNLGTAPPPTPPPPPPSSGAPPQAVAVGYTMRTHGPAITLGTNWFVSQQTASQNSDGSVFLSQDVYHFNENIASDHMLPNGNIGGVAFGGGAYFEADFSMANPPPESGKGGPGWPAWWLNAAESVGYNNLASLSNNQNLEYDMAEFLVVSNSVFSTGPIHWYTGGNYSDLTAGFPNGNLTVPNPGSNTFGARHKYGLLWVPATATTQGYSKLFYDNVEVGRTHTWDRYGGGTVPGQAGCPPFSIFDLQHCRLLIGANAGNALTVYTITVWQRNDASNIRVGVPLPP